MKPRPFTIRIATAVSLAAAATGVAALPAHATDGPPPQPYTLTVSADPAATDYGHRTVDVSGVLTRADGTPVANASVDVTESVLFATWNPWGDPIPPTEASESHALGPVTTDENGRFTLPGTVIAHFGNGSMLGALATVDIDAQWDPDGNPDTYDSVYGYTEVRTPGVQTGVSAKVDRTRVHKGDVLTVTGTVSVPAGHGSPAGTQVFLRAFWEDEWSARATADATGHYTIKYPVRGYDQDFEVITAPQDLYLTGADASLPVHNPVGITYSNLSATVDRNGVATVQGRLNQGCYQYHKEKVNLQFAKKGEKVWHTVATAVNDADGWLKATYKGGNGLYRWSHPESDNCVLYSSASRTVYRTMERIAGFRATPQPVRKGQPLRLSGTLQYLDGSVWRNRGTHPVEIWYRPTSVSTWVRKAVVQSNTKGYFQKTVTAGADGWWRAVQVGDATTYTSVSPSGWVDVR
ncbi:hypothetical protein [Actinacidiphila acididurans]|uniref:Carboxypeptidase regulatory-like domain-containing protein n=1 Tax=Actinacidiphila acididurans TaxID=2784346 RepID=A0ABS2TLJ8_9ACTN|nr:hypothetical protein [Actinacidiphila acididurans]MBM9504216.1 hypothetical protein [Actinacidiphila acididurans]